MDEIMITLTKYKILCVENYDYISWDDNNIHKFKKIKTFNIIKLFHSSQCYNFELYNSQMESNMRCIRNVNF